MTSEQGLHIDRLQRQLADAQATEAVLRGEIRRSEHALSTFDDVVAERDAALARSADMEARIRDAQAEAWDEAVEATLEWVQACGRPGDNGPPDPPLNRYETSQPQGLGEPEGARDGQNTGVHPDRPGHPENGSPGSRIHRGPGVPDHPGPDPSGRGADEPLRGVSDEGGDLPAVPLRALLDAAPAGGAE